MGDFFVNLFWWALYALPVVVVVGIPLLVWRSRRRRADQLDARRPASPPAV